MIPKLFLNYVISICFSLIFSAALSGCNDNDNDTAMTQVQREGSIVYLGDLSIAGTEELYANNLYGTNQRKLSGTMVSGGSVVANSSYSDPAYVVSPDGLKVAYTADQDVDGVIELYVADIDGNTCTKVSHQPSGWNANIHSYKWSPDSTHLSYLSDQDTENVHELYTVRYDGSENTKVNVPLSGNERLKYFYSWSPDGDYLSYVKYSKEPGSNEYESVLYTVHPDATRNTNINSIISPELPGLDYFQWSPDGMRLAYSVYRYKSETYTVEMGETYTVKADGTGNTKVSIDGTIAVQLGWSPTGTHLYYVDHTNSGSKRLYTVAPDGTDNTLVSISDFIGYLYLQWSPDGQYLSYRTAGSEVYVANYDGSDTLKVCDNLIPICNSPRGCPHYPSELYSWSTDSSHLACISYASPESFTSTEFVYLYTAKPDGSENNIVSGKDVIMRLFQDNDSEPIWSPDGTSLAYIHDFSELYTVRPDGRENIKVSGTIVSDGLLFGKISWSKDGGSLVYRASQDAPEVYELYSVDSDGSDLMKINSPPVVGSHGVSSYTIFDDSSNLQ